MRRGEIWLVSLDPTIGAEIRKTRPAVIVSDDAIGVLPLRVIVPLTEWKDSFARAPWMVKIAVSRGSGLTKVSSADAVQVRSVSTARLVSRLGAVSASELKTIGRAIACVCSIPSAS